MNLWLRLLWLIATAWRRPKLALPFGVSRLGFRVWPHDLDTSLHLNNGRYWTLMDLGRTDLMLGSGLWRAVLRQRWTPVVSAGQIRFRRELRPFQTFDLETLLALGRDPLRHRAPDGGPGDLHGRGHRAGSGRAL